MDYNLHGSFWSLKVIFFQTQCIHFFQYLTKFLYKCCRLLQFIPLVNFKAMICTLHSTPTVETCFQLGFFNDSFTSFAFESFIYRIATFRYNSCFYQFICQMKTRILLSFKRCESSIEVYVLSERTVSREHHWVWPKLSKVAIYYLEVIPSWKKIFFSKEIKLELS